VSLRVVGFVKEQGDSCETFGLEIKGLCCGGWHVLYRPEGHEQDSTAARGFLYWRCPKRGGVYYGGSVGHEAGSRGAHDADSYRGFGSNDAVNSSPER
jgi:hypothetical protein